MIADALLQYVGFKHPLSAAGEQGVLQDPLLQPSLMLKHQILQLLLAFGLQSLQMLFKR